MSATSDNDDAADFARACRVFSITQARIDILTYALSAEEVTATELVAALKISRSGLERHLKELTALGVLAERRANQQRGHGQLILWRVADRVLLERLWDTVSGQIDAGFSDNQNRP